MNCMHQERRFFYPLRYIAVREDSDQWKKKIDSKWRNNINYISPCRATLHPIEVGVGISVLVVVLAVEVLCVFAVPRRLESKLEDDEYFARLYHGEGTEFSKGNGKGNHDRSLPTDPESGDVSLSRLLELELAPVTKELEFPNTP